MKELKELFKKHPRIWNILSFLIPIVILLVVFDFNKVYFNGNRLLISDMRAQYVHMLVYFRKIFIGSENIFYSITKGLGGEMYSTICYYLLSPFNLITLLFSENNIIHAVYLIVILKIGTCGFTMFKLLDYKSRDNKLSSLIFSLCYSLMAFVVNNYFCIMWLDVVYLAPLVILGLEKLVNEKKCMLYMISLFLTLICNFVLGYMVCLFSVIYFIYLIINKYEKKDKKIILEDIKRFIISSILAGTSASIIIIPTIISLTKTSRGYAPDLATISGVIKRLFVGSYDMDSFLSYYEPNIYCGTIVTLFVCLFIFDSNFKLKKKLSSIFIIFIFIASIFIPQLSYVWHGFSYPVGFNFRFTFLMSLFLILIAYEEFINIKKLDKFQIFICLYLIVASIFAYIKFGNIYWNIVTILVVTLYTIVLLLNIGANIKKILFYLIVIFELFFNTYSCFIKESFIMDYSLFKQTICDNLEENNYRVSGYEYYSGNEVLSCGKSSTSAFYSTMNSKITSFYSKVGLIGGGNYYHADKSTPIMDSLLSVKEAYYKSDNLDYKLNKMVNSHSIETGDLATKTIYFYKNPYVLNLGYKVYNIKDIQTDDVFMYQNELFKNYSGIEEDVLKKVDSDSAIDSNYIYIFTNEEAESLIINGIEQVVPEKDKITKVEASFDENIDIHLYKEDGETYNYYAYYIDMNAFEKGIDKIKEHQLQNIQINKNVITGDIYLDEDSKVLFSIPYEEGWHIYVDGKKIDYGIANDMFIYINLNSGKHSIELRYYPKGILISLIISILSIITSIFYIKDNNLKSNKVLYIIISILLLIIMVLSLLKGMNII